MQPAELTVFSPSEDGEHSAYQQWKAQAKALVEGLPEEGAAIVVVTHETGRQLKAGIRQLRGSRLARRCRVIAVRNMNDCNKLLGLSSRVVVDGSLRLWAKDGVYNHALRLAAASNLAGGY